MISRRRLTLQLTPLLDMLLIVVFIQYFQLREREVIVAGEHSVLIEERAVTQKELKELSLRMQDLQRQLAVSEVETLQAQDAAMRDRQSAKQSEASLDRVLAQQQVLGELVTELFKIPPQEVKRILSEARSPVDTRTPAERAKLEERFEQLAAQSPGRMLEHLLSYDEIRKRCDVWNLHIDAQGIITLTDGQRPARIRLPLSPDGDVLTEQFVNELFTWYRSLSQSKSLVVILLTYDRDTRIYVTESVRNAMPEWVTRMQADSAGRSRFEYADLGFRIE